MSKIVNRACFFVALALFVCSFGLSASSDAAARRTTATVRTAQAAGQLKTIQAASSSGTAPCQDAIGDEPDHDGDNCDYVVPNQVDTGDTNAGDNGNQSCPGGCTTWNYSPMTVSLTLHDAPISYRPPVGPAIAFDVYYSQRDVASTGSFFTTNLGPQWTNSWLSYVTDTVTSNGAATLYRRGGGTEPYSLGIGGTTSQLSPYTQAILTRQVDGSGKTTGFARTLKDGSVEQFAFAGAGVFLMTAVIDAHGNKVALAYDSKNRLSTITDAIGQITTLSYGLSADPLKLTSITDPFGRSATFAYTSDGQLASLTDTLGITSSYTYGPGNFVKALTTPYGTTAFTFSDNTTDSTLGTTRILMATDPLDQTTRVEFNQAAPGISATDSVVPSGVSVGNFNLNIRNSFVWNPYQYKLATASAGLDYTQAKIIHWLNGPGSTVSRVMESVKEPLQSRVWFNYAGQADPLSEGANNLPTLVTRVLDDGSTQVQTFQYNPAGNLTQAVDAIGRTTNYVYAANGIDLLSVSNATTGDTLAAMTYDGQHNLLSRTGANGSTASVLYNNAGQPTQVTDPLGNRSTFSYSAKGYLTATQGPIAGATLSFSYDSAGRVATATDPGGSLISYTYDNADRPVTVTYPDGTKTALSYNLLDTASVTDRLGQKTLLAHDAQRQLTQVTDPLGQVIKYGYSPDGKLTSITDANGHATSFTLDLQSRVVQKTYADGTQQGVVYETSTNRVAKLIDAKGQTTDYAYNPDDTLAGLVYGNATNPTASVSYTYDSGYRRPLTMTDGIGTTSYTYYPVKSGVALGANLVQNVISPVAGAAATDTVVYTYDALGRVVSRSINGVVQATTFDALGRVTAVANALDSFSYAYADATARVSAISSTTGPKVALGYFDPKGDELLKSLTYSTATGASLGAYSYTYDANHNVLSFSQPFKDSKFAAAAGVAVIGAAGGDSNIERDIISAALSAAPVVKGAKAIVAGWVAKLIGITPVDFFLFVLAGAVAFALRQVATRWGRRLLWPAVPIAATLALASCSWDGGDGSDTLPGASNPTTLTSSYAYDSASRLLSATASTDVAKTLANPTASFAYDPASNLTTFTTGGSTQPLQYTATNTISSGTYDTNGNPSTLGTNQYTWDAANRIITAASGSNTSAFTYDGQSRLVRIVDKQNGAVVADKSYLWCGMARCLEHDNTKPGSPVSKQYFSQGVVDNGNALYYINDRLGSVRQLLDASGIVQTKYDYDPYGARTKTSGTVDTDMGYAGYFKHGSSGLDFAVFRAYDSQRGRWVNRDPIGENGGLNNYSYAGNNPTRYRDSTGLCPICAWAFYYAVVYAEEITLGTIIAAEVASGVPTPVSAEFSFGGRLAQEVSHDVYLGIKNGEPVYAGISKDIAARACQHGDRFDSIVQLTTSQVTKDQARAIEQALINNNPNFQNEINSIASTRSWYDEAAQWGNDWLEKIGF